MTEDVFSAIRTALDVPAVAAAYGVAVNAQGFALCPFHSEKTPSLKLHPASWHCFGCGAGGSVIDFAAQMFGLSPIEAARRLDEDFRLNLFSDKPQSPDERKRAAEAAHRRKDDSQLCEAFGAWWNEARRTVCWYSRHLKDEIERLRPRSQEDGIPDAFAAAVLEAGTVDYMLDCLMSEGWDSKIDFYAGWCGKVEDIERIRKSRETEKHAAA